MNKLTSIWLFAIMICGTCYSFMTHFPYTSHNIQTVMISMAISTAIQFLLVLPVAYLKKQFPNDNVCSALMRKNKIIGIITTTFYTLVFMAAVFSLIGNFTYYLRFYFAAYIPEILIVIGCISAAVYLGCMRAGVLGKTSLCVIILFVIFTFAIIAGAFKKFSFLNFNLAEENLTKAVFDGIKSDFALDWDLVIFVFLLGDLQDHLKKGRKNSDSFNGALKTAGIYCIAKLVILETILGFITMILGDYGTVSKLSFFSMASYSSSGFIQRFDAAFMFLWVIMALVKLSAFIHCGAKGLSGVIPEISFTTSAIICGVIPSVTALFLLVPHKWQRGEFFQGGTILQIFALGIIPLFALIFLKKGKNNEKS